MRPKRAASSKSAGGPRKKTKQAALPPAAQTADALNQIDKTDKTDETDKTDTAPAASPDVAQFDRRSWYEPLLRDSAHVVEWTELREGGTAMSIKLPHYTAVVGAHINDDDTGPDVLCTNARPPLSSTPVESLRYSFTLGDSRVPGYLTAEQVVTQLCGWGATRGCPIAGSIWPCIPVLARLSDLTFEITVENFGTAIRHREHITFNGSVSLFGSKWGPGAVAAWCDYSKSRYKWGHVGEATTDVDSAVAKLRHSLQIPRHSPPEPLRSAEDITEGSRIVLDALGVDLAITHYVRKDSPYLHINFPPYTALLAVDPESPVKPYGFKIADTSIIPDSKPWRWFQDVPSIAAELRKWFVTGFDCSEWYTPVLDHLADLNLSPVFDGTDCRLVLNECTAILRVREKSDSGTQPPQPGAPIREPQFSLEIRDHYGSHLHGRADQPPATLADDIRTWGNLLPTLLHLPAPAPLPVRKKRKQENPTLTVGNVSRVSLSSEDEARMRADVKALEDGIANVTKFWPRDEKRRLALKQVAILASFGDSNDPPGSPRQCLVLKSADKLKDLPAFSVDLVRMSPANVRDWRHARERWTLDSPPPLTPTEQAQRELVAQGNLSDALSAAGIQVSYALRMFLLHGIVPSRGRENPPVHEAPPDVTKDVLFAIAPWRIAEAARRGRSGALAGSQGSCILLRGTTLDLCTRSLNKNKWVQPRSSLPNLADSDWADDGERSRPYQ